MSKLHRWALLDKKGRNRGTCEAKNYADAKGNFLSKRRSPIPKGWRIVDRGPVEDDTLALAADPTPEPRAFKVGDEVECTKGGNPWWRPGDRATLTKQDHDGDWIGLVHRTNYQTWVHESDKRGGWHNTCRLVPAAPQPKAEARRVDVDLLIAERDGLLVLKAEHEGEIATLKSEVEKLTTERNTALCGADLLKASRDGFQEALDATKARAESAEAKLDDIKALFRANTIMAAMPGEPTFGEAIEHVIGGAA